MAMNKVPTLILGIGGIGCRIAANISDMLSPEDRLYVGIVGMDTNVNDLSQLSKRGIKTIQTSDERMVQDYLQLHPEYLKWFPTNRFLVGRGMTNGAGQIRAISRLAALAAEESGAFIPIEEEIRRIRTNRGEGNNGNLTVMVVGSITGGTGAGIFLQMPFYIRRLLQHTTGLNAIVIRGMFIGPDISASFQPSDVNREAVRVNGYACLKELNALYMTQTTPRDKDCPIELDFYEPGDPEQERAAERKVKETLISARSEFYPDEEDFPLDSLDQDAHTIAASRANIPYDYLYLIEGEGTATSGSIGNVSPENLEGHVARMVFTLMFSPVTKNALSVEDNMILQSIAKGGMNRYSSAGMCRLVYPSDLAREYVTLRSVQELVQAEWMLLDRRFTDSVIEARSLKATDGSVEIPLMKKAYPALFEEEVKQREGRLGSLFGEAFVEDPKTHETVCRAQSFLRGLKSLVDGLSKEPEMVAKAKAAIMIENKMKTFADAKKEIGRLEQAMEDYATAARRAVEANRVSFANRLFPPTWASMRGAMHRQECVYSLLSTVHPVTARYFCYYLINELEEEIARLERKLKGINLGLYESQDFDPKTAGKQRAASVLSAIQEKKRFGDESKRIQPLASILRTSAEAQCSQISDHMLTTVKLSNARVLLSRFEQLAENYRLFFQTIGSVIEENNKRITQLADVHMPLGQEGVYCSREALETMAIEYQNEVDQDLPDETRKAVFEQLFRVMADDFASASKMLSERQKEQRAARKRTTLSRLFRTAVEDTLRTDVVKRGSNIVDMNVRQALIRQMELETGDTEDNSPTFKEDSIAYIRGKIETAMRRAAPMLALDQSTMAENTELVYLALNPDCAETQQGEPSAAATKELYVPEICAATDGVPATVIMDEEFSPYEIICFKARYKFLIEDLIQYRPGSKNALAYQARIQRLGRAPINPDHPDSFVTVVNPHLNRYWHEEGFIPAISADQRRKNNEDIRKAFIYGMGLDLFHRMVDEDLLDNSGKGRQTWFVLSARGLIPMTSKGKLVGNTYADLYKALPFNGRIRDYVLAMAKSAARRAKGYAEPEEMAEDILRDEFIADLAQDAQDAPADGEEGEENILDIFLKMREHMDHEQWNELFPALLDTIWEYCAILFDRNERLVNHVTPGILNLIYDNSVVGRKERSGQGLESNEMRAKEQFKLLSAPGKRYYK